MSFVSLEFAILFLITLLAHHLAYRHLWLQNLIILLASLIFYGAWSFKFLGLLLLVASLNYGAAISIETFRGLDKKILVVGVILNLMLLGVFKYAK